MSRIIPAPIIGQSAASGAQVIDGSLKFDSSKKTVLHRTFSAGNTRTWTFSMWTRKQNNDCHFLTSGTSADRFNAGWVQGNDKLFIYIQENNAEVFNVNSVARFRDNGWYHVVIVADTANANNDDRIIVYINNERINDWTGNTTISQYASTHLNTATSHAIGNRYYNNSDYVSGMFAQTYLLDGVALEPENFGFTDPLTNTWRPKKYTGVFNGSASGTIYSSTITMNGGSPNYGTPASMFNGDNTDTGRLISAPNGNITWDASSYNLSGTLRVKTQTYRKVTVTHSGGSTTLQATSSTALHWLDFGNLTNITSVVGFADSDGKNTGVIAAVEFAGSTLIDGTPAGVNGFYLPMDGNSPIGQDQSGNGNDFTPVNFGGSLELDNSNVSGARPILNTTQGGSQAALGVFGSKENRYYTLTGSSGSGNGYVFENEGTKPTLSMIRGVTYTFDYSAASSHPFRFATAADAAGSTGYTSGTSISGNVISFTVPHDAPATLYYYCTNHSGMGNSISVTTDETKADKYASNCVLAVPLVGGSSDLSGSINATQTSKVFTNSNGPSYVTTLSNFYAGSGDFTGSSTQKRIDYATSGGAFGFGTADFTIEWWMYATTNADGNHYVWDTTGQKSSLIRKNGGGMTFETNGSSGSIGEVTILSSGSYNLNKWAHWAVVRDGDTVYVYIDGVLKQKTTGFSGVNFGDVNGHIGGYNGGGAGFNPDAHLQDFRIYKGIAKYTGTSVGTQYFTVPSRSPDVLPDTPSGVSGGSKLTKITDGAVIFDGSGDYLNLANSSDFVVGTGDFTMECYIYQKSQGSEATVFGLKHTGGSGWTGYKFYINTSGGFVFYAEDAGSGDWDIILSAGNGTVSLNRWHHLSATRNGNTFRVFVDGVEKASSTSSVDLNDGGDGFYISQNGGNQQYFNGFISNVRVIKGTALYTSSFTPPTRALTNVTNTKLLCCQSNTSATEGAVKPGTITANGDAVATNFNPFNTDINAVRGQETGYATLNPLDNQSFTLSDGNLNVTNMGSARQVHADIFVDSGKWYAEFTCKAAMNDTLFGVANNLGLSYLGADANSWGVISINGNSINGNSQATYGSSFTTGDTISVALDMDNGKWYAAKNGIFFNGGNPVTGTNPAHSNLTGSITFAVGSNNSGGDVSCNFGQKPFKFSPPDGFQPLNNANARPETVIVRPDQFVGVTTYSGAESGSGGLTRHINTGKQPDFVWIKQRNQAYSTGHQLYDSVRSAGAEKELDSSSTAAEGAGNIETYGWVNSFDKTGFTTKGGSSDYDYVNKSGVNYVAWTWKAGGNAGTFNIDDVGYASAAAAGLTGGTATVTGASVGTKQGFSIIKYTTTSSAGNFTVPHGLSEAPTFIITRKISGGNWITGHDALGWTKYLVLNTSAAGGTNANAWGNSSPTSSVFGGNDANFYGNGVEQISYIWHNVPGLQKFGSCRGSGTSAAPDYVELGFKPSIVWVKRTDNTGYWTVWDSNRNKFNPSQKQLYITTNDDEQDLSADAIDILSDGFTIRSSSAFTQTGSQTYVYCAWAEAPTVNLYGGQSNAR